ncbi:MAG: dipeptidase [Acidimicrobiia bacterium]|nr:dipeptidase [Acidimicrobiia bacterium]
MADLTSKVHELMPGLVATLRELVEIPSVSASGYPASEVRRSAERVRELLAEAGASNAELLEYPGAHPAVFASVDGPEDAPTVLLYAHHDVQPPGPSDEWETEPFVSFERAGRLYGRGASDDKSGVIMHLGTLRAFEGEPPVNIKVFIEGEEEIGSAHLSGFLDTYADQMRADVIVIADSGNWRVGEPALTTSLRGLVACVVEVRTAEKAVHSGMFGGVFPDAVTTLARLLATLHTDDGEVAVSGLVSGESEPLDLTEDEVRSAMGAVQGLSSLGTGSLTSRMWTKPAIAMLAIDAPPLSEAINQLVPVARAKVSMRIAPGQDPNDAMNALRDHLIANIPWGAEVTITGVESGEAFQLPLHGPAVDAFRASMEQVWDTDVVEMGVGGSIPFVADFSSRYPESAILLTGAGDPTSAVHAPNESQDLDDLQKAVLAQVLALGKIGVR